MIDSIDNSMAAPIRDAEGSGAVSPETDALSETAVQTEPFPPLLGEDGGFAPDWYARFDELKGMEEISFRAPDAAGSGEELRGAGTPATLSRRGE